VLLDKSRDKKAARLQKASESATEKAVHEVRSMLPFHP